MTGWLWVLLPEWYRAWVFRRATFQLIAAIRDSEKAFRAGSEAINRLLEAMRQVEK
jgi:hypothetical protein